MTGFMTLGLNRTQDTLRAVSGEYEEKYRSDHVPLRVAVVLDIVFTLSEGIPKLDGPVAGP